MQKQKSPPSFNEKKPTYYPDFIFWDHFILLPHNLKMRESQEKLIFFFEDIIAGKKNTEILGDFSMLEEQLPYSKEQLLEQLLASVFRSQSLVEFALKKHAWITAARAHPPEAAVSSSIMLSELEEEISVKTLTNMMLSSDFPLNREEDWNLDKYWPVFKATQEDPFDRLVVYAYDAAPNKALEMMFELYGGNISEEDKESIIEKADEIAWNLRRHDQLFAEGESVDEIVDFFVELT